MLWLRALHHLEAHPLFVVGGIYYLDSLLQGESLVGGIRTRVDFRGGRDWFGGTGLEVYMWGVW